jgi:hypothetical protein
LSRNLDECVPLSMGLSEQDAFLSNIGMCMVTLWELGVSSPGGGPGWRGMDDT